MPEYPVNFQTNPNNDIVNQEETFFFGQKALKNSVSVSKVGGKGLESSCRLIQTVKANGAGGYDTETDGSQTCWGVKYNYTLLSQEPHIYNPTFTGTQITYYTYKDGEINIRIAWTAYTEAPPSPEKIVTPAVVTPPIEEPTSGGGSITPTVIENTITETIPVQTEEKWIQTQTILHEGFKIHSISSFLKNKIDKRQIDSLQNIRNNCIPDRDHAKRIGHKAIYDSRKDNQYEPSIVPNYKLVPLTPINLYIPILYLNPRKTITDGVIFNNNCNDTQMILSCRFSKKEIIP